MGSRPLRSKECINGAQRWLLPLTFALCVFNVTATDFRRSNRTPSAREVKELANLIKNSQPRQCHTRRRLALNEMHKEEHELVPLEGADIAGQAKIMSTITKGERKRVVVKTFVDDVFVNENCVSDYYRERDANDNLSQQSKYNSGNWPEHIVECCGKDDKNQTLFFQQYDESMTKVKLASPEEIIECAIQVFKGYYSVLAADLYHGDIMNDVNVGPNLGNILRRKNRSGGFYYALHDFGLSGSLENEGGEGAALKDLFGLVYIFSNDFKVPERLASFGDKINRMYDDSSEELPKKATLQSLCEGVIAELESKRRHSANPRPKKQAKFELTGPVLSTVHGKSTVKRKAKPAADSSLKFKRAQMVEVYSTKQKKWIEATYINGIDFGQDEGKHYVSVKRIGNITLPSNRVRVGN